MAQGQLNAVVRHLRRLAGAPATELTDRHLLERFAAARDEPAFATLVERHGPLVWGVCRRVLTHHHDAEDVYQAAFLVLARKAAAISWRDSVSNWLYQVAYRLASEARVQSARRSFHESQAARKTRPLVEHDIARQELCALLDQELYGLPDKYRSALLLCYLQGLTSDQAARQLGWSLRTLERRLAQGRELLRRRLTRRGVTLSAALLAPLLATGTSTAAVPPVLVRSAIQAACGFAGGTMESSVGGAALANGFMKGVAMSPWKLAAALVLTLAGLTGGGLVVRHVVAAQVPTEGDEAAKQEKDDRSSDATAAKSEVKLVAEQLWEILEVIGKQHLEPRPRAEMIVAGLRGFRQAATTDVPLDKMPSLDDEKLGLTADVLRRAGAVKTREEFSALLISLWPQDKNISRERLQTAFLEGVSRRVGGELRVLPKMEMKIQEEISGNRYIGTGIQIKMNQEEDRVQIMTAMRRGPARRAGVKTNDILLQVNGKDTKGVSVRTVVEWVRGEEGTPVTFVVKQPGANETRTCKMTRGIVPFESVVGCRRATGDDWYYRPDPQSPIAYVHVNSLRTSTLQELRQVEPKLRAQGLRALVLDFRSSSGDGIVRNAALFADGLLDGGVMWSSRGVDENSRKEYRADRECLFRGWPMAVLIDDTLDRQHALVVAALQDNGRAIVVGQPTKNDGYVNTMVTLPDGKTGLIFRTGILERADKERGWPVNPDHAVGMDAKQRGALEEWRRKQELTEEPTDEKAPADPQLNRALELLREALNKAPAKAKP
jgi:C-terminal peptidase prc